MKAFVDGSDCGPLTAQKLPAHTGREANKEEPDKATRVAFNLPSL